MRAALRLAVVTGVLSFGSGLYACSADDGGDIAPPNDPERPATPNASETGVTPPSPERDATTPPDPNQPVKCAIVDSNNANLPVLEPAACKTCAAQKCCAPLTKCFGSAPADAGLDGSNGKKTTCQLFGECELACNGAALCEAQCGITYGETAAAEWVASDSCLYAPAGCATFCN